MFKTGATSSRINGNEATTRMVYAKPICSAPEPTAVPPKTICEPSAKTAEDMETTCSRPTGGAGRDDSGPTGGVPTAACGVPTAACDWGPCGAEPLVPLLLALWRDTTARLEAPYCLSSWVNFLFSPVSD